MNLFRPFINPNKNDDVPHCYNRVRYIRDSCKIFSDLWKNEKDFLNKSVDNDVSKSFKEFRQSEIGRNYRTCETNSSSNEISILNQTIDDLIDIHEFIDLKRKESFEQMKKLIDFARDKQNQIRQTMNDLRENYEKAQRKLEIADSNLRKFQSRSDRLTIGNFEEKSRELEDIRYDCEMNRTLTRDQYSAEIYQFASEEYLISKYLFSQYLFEQNSFYKNIFEYFSSKMPQIENRLNRDEFVPLIGLDLIKHCSTRENQEFIAYPIQICIHLLENHLREEGIFRQAPSMIKFKKFLAQLNLQFIDKTTTIEELYLDVHVPASALKHYLRELPDCLLTNQLFHQWNQIASINDEQIRFHRIKELLDQLPRIHFLNLRYLIRFLTRVVQYSSENRMTSNNLAICIGNSILFSKDQQQQQQNPSSLSMNYTNGSIILEMLINHHEEYFPSQSPLTSNRNLRIPPDLIPTEFHSKSRSNSNENILENSSSSNSTNFIQPSPITRRKGKAPPPPPVPILPSSTPTPTPTSTSTEMIPSIDSQITSSSTSKNLILENSSEDLKTNEEFSKDQSKRNIFQRFSTVKTSLSSGLNDRIHRRTLSGGWNSNDRPILPPPLPPTTTNPIKTKQRHSTSTMIDEENLDKDREDLNRSTSIEEKKEETSDESVNVGKVIAELNHRMANAKNSPFHRSQTSSTTTTNRRYSSSFRNTIHQSSPGETTDF